VEGKSQFLSFDLTFEGRNSTYAILECWMVLWGPSCLLDTAKLCEYNEASGMTTTPLIPS
jgi:hypothetical protein